MMNISFKIEYTRTLRLNVKVVALLTFRFRFLLSPTYFPSILTLSYNPCMGLPAYLCHINRSGRDEGQKRWHKSKNQYHINYLI